MSTTTTTRYGIRRTIDLPWDEAVARARDVLQEEGFGILSEIDIQAKLKEKLGVEFGRYIILGACNPPLAHKALLAEPDIGLLLPCNVIVYEEGDHSVVAAMDPGIMAQVVGENAPLLEVARDARERLERAMKNF